MNTIAKQQSINDEREILYENSKRFFALEDNFEALYDVELESGHYVSFDRDEFYKRNVSDMVVSATEFFGSLRANIDKVVYEEDREAAYNVQTRESIVRQLAVKDHIDHYYRIITENGLMWLKMRIVYKDASKRNVIVGIFNAEEEMAARQQEEAFKQELIQNNTRLFALEDNFESLYDVELASGHYDVFVKGDYYRNNVLGKLSVPTDYFEELRTNIDAVIYAEDRDALYNTLTRESIRRELAESEHFDYFYRINSPNGPTWFKMRIVYKDAERKNVIIGVFNAENDVEAKQLAEQKAKIEESLTFTNFFLDTYISAYYVNLEDLSCQVYKRTSDLEKNYPIIADYISSLTDYISRDVHPEDREALLEIVRPEKMRDILRTKREYSHIFRDISNGVVKTYRMQVIRCADVNHAAFGFIDISEEVKEQNERLKEAEAYQKLIESIAATYNIAYAVNLENDTFKLIRMDDFIIGAGKTFNTFTEAKEFFIGLLPESDRNWMRNELDYDTIREKLSHAKSYNVEYRLAVNNAMLWHEMNVTVIDSEHVAIGFAVKDLEITKKHLEEKRFSEYFALYEIDIDSGTLKIIKDSPWYGVNRVGTALPYKQEMLKFASTLDDKPRNFFEQIAELETVKQQLATEDKHTYAYRSNNIGEKKWVECTGIVTMRHSDGTPAMFTLGFSLLDSIGIQQQELQSRLAENMQMIGGLATGYDTLYYINIDADVFRVYNVDESKLPEVKKINGKSKGFFDSLTTYGASEMIHPDDRQLFADFSAEDFRRRLAHSKKFELRFRHLLNGEYQWVIMEAVKYEAINEQANAIAIGFVNRDVEIRGEQTLSTCFGILGKEIPPQDAMDELLKVTGEFYGAERCYVFEYTKNREELANTYEWCADGVTAMISKLQNVPANEIDGWLKEFKRHGAFAVDVLDESTYSTPEGKALLEMQGIQSLIAVPLMNGNEIIGMLGVDNPSKAKQNVNVLKNVATVAYSEILRRKANDEEHVTLLKLTDTFLSVYFVDLSRDYMHTWKIADEYKDAYGSVLHYSESMGHYVREDIAERDRERCIEMTSPAYVLEQFRNTDRFSIDMTDILTGQERNVIFDYVKVSDDGRQFVICSRDVTDSLAKERAQQKLLDDARVAAEAANIAKTNFLFSMSHDIRTPMNAITGFTNMAIKHIDDREKTLDCLDKIQKSGSMLLSLINSVLEVSRIEAGKATLEELHGDVIYSFANIENTLLELAKTKDIDLTFEFGEIRDRFVYADFSRCMRIFVNVISNAIKYTNEGGYVKVRCEQVGEAKDGYAKYQYTVTDNGIGMSEEFQKHVFEQFARENTATVSGIQGSGLGMSVVKSFVELIGGTIDVKSKQGEGSTFTIVLPLKLQKGENFIDPVTGELVNSVAPAVNTVEIDFTGRRVLLVEDNELNREIASEILGEEGLVIEEAEDGSQAVEMLKANGPDYYEFILMDIQMPVMNGYDATKAIRAMYPDAKIPIIALSANAFAEDKKRSLEAGMNDHVAKPIKIKELFAALAKFIN